MDFISNIWFIKAGFRFLDFISNIWFIKAGFRLPSDLKSTVAILLYVV